MTGQIDLVTIKTTQTSDLSASDCVSVMQSQEQDVQMEDEEDFQEIMRLPEEDLKGLKSQSAVETDEDLEDKEDVTPGGTGLVVTNGKVYVLIISCIYLLIRFSSYTVCLKPTYCDSIY